MTHHDTTDTYDDGLVHAHDWARALPPGTHHRTGRTHPAKRPVIHVAEAADFDDGLVHEHAWARQ
ncbi:MAG TPA: hypothetical protein VMI52_02165 [Acetobacteraceae bacterium]|nr:hypothetical protein [Acetobacteraceae bacterium]